MELSEMIEKTIELQKNLNSFIDLYWLDNRKFEDFDIAIMQECSELIDSYNWKWWSSGKENNFNKKVELVDIFHFLLSKAIKFKEYVDNEYRIEAEIELSYKDPYKLRERWYKDYSDLEMILLFMKETLNNVEPNFSHFFELVRRHFNSLEEFLRWYFVKNVLNEIRQIKGYKSGRYDKFLSGIEDNEVIYKLSENIEFTDFSEFRENLINKYIYYITARQDFV